MRPVINKTGDTFYVGDDADKRQMFPASFALGSTSRCSELEIFVVADRCPTRDIHGPRGRFQTGLNCQCKTFLVGCLLR